MNLETALEKIYRQLGSNIVQTTTLISYIKDYVNAKESEVFEAKSFIILLRGENPFKSLILIEDLQSNYSLLLNKYTRLGMQQESVIKHLDLCVKIITGKKRTFQIPKSMSKGNINQSSNTLNSVDLKRTYTVYEIALEEYKNKVFNKAIPLLKSLVTTNIYAAYLLAKIYIDGESKQKDVTQGIKILNQGKIINKDTLHVSNNAFISPQKLIKISNCKKININGNVKSLPVGFIKENSIVEEVIINSNISKISRDAFKNCTKLKKVTLPSSVTSIDESSFEGCTKLMNININQVAKLGNNSFRFCTSLSKLNFSSSLTSIPNGTFEGCNNLTQLVLPKNVTKVGSRSFYNCKKLYISSFPKKLRSFGNDAFTNTQVSIHHVLDIYPKYVQNLKSVTSLNNFVFETPDSTHVYTKDNQNIWVSVNRTSLSSGNQTFQFTFNKEGVDFHKEFRIEVFVSYLNSSKKILGTDHDRLLPSGDFKSIQRSFTSSLKDIKYVSIYFRLYANRGLLKRKEDSTSPYLTIKLL